MDMSSKPALSIIVIILVYLSCQSECETLAGHNEERSKRILLEDNYYTIISKLDLLTKKVETLEAANALMSHPPVSFMAYLTTDVSGANQHIYFDDVKLNFGNAYNPHHGTFVAPVNGTYQFSITVCSGGGHYVSLDVVINTSVLGSMLAGDASYGDCASKVFLAYLTTGDDVYVKHDTAGDYLAANLVYGLPSFTGVLLQAH